MWFILALFAGFLFAANKLIFRAAFSKGVDPLRFLAAHELLAGILLLPVALFSFSLPQSSRIWLAVVLGVLFIFLADLFATLSLRKTEASLYQIVGQLRHLIVLIGGYFLFTEVITLSKVVSIIFIILGVLIAITNKSKVKITTGIVYAFISTVCIALASLCIKLAAEEVKVAFLASLSLIISGILSYFLIIVIRKRPVNIMPSKNRGPLLIAAIIFAIFELALFTALDIGEASRVTPVTQSSMIFTIIGGYMFLGEHSRIRQKIIGSILIVIGIGLLYFV